MTIFICALSRFGANGTTFSLMEGSASPVLFSTPNTDALFSPVSVLSLISAQTCLYSGSCSFSQDGFVIHVQLEKIVLGADIIPVL
ncbi:MAG: hypothetical protein KAH11_10065, partial [Rhodospirillales bacterium]|nr:hypothetical protein [Rhodospirillales bacterium]